MKIWEFTQDDVAEVCEKYLAKKYGLEWSDSTHKWLPTGGLEVSFDVVDDEELSEEDSDDYDLEEVDEVPLNFRPIAPFDANSKVEKFHAGGYDSPEDEEDDDEPEICNQCGSENLTIKENSITRKPYLKCGNCGSTQELS